MALRQSLEAAIERDAVSAESCIRADAAPFTSNDL